jgi:hypothetical protein
VRLLSSVSCLKLIGKNSIIEAEIATTAILQGALLNGKWNICCSSQQLDCHEPPFG